MHWLITTFENAYSTGGVTKQQLDQTKLNLVTSKSRLQQAKVNVGDTNIKSTINGIVNKSILNLVQFSVQVRQCLKL
jgi:multidrug resistance efflux pump